MPTGRPAVEPIHARGGGALLEWFIRGEPTASVGSLYPTLFSSLIQSVLQKASYTSPTPPLFA